MKWEQYANTAKETITGVLVEYGILRDVSDKISTYIINPFWKDYDLQSKYENQTDFIEMVLYLTEANVAEFFKFVTIKDKMKTLFNFENEILQNYSTGNADNTNSYMGADFEQPRNKNKMSQTKTHSIIDKDKLKLFSYYQSRSNEITKNIISIYQIMVKFLEVGGW